MQGLGEGRRERPVDGVYKGKGEQRRKEWRGAKVHGDR